MILDIQIHIHEIGETENYIKYKVHGFQKE